MRAERGYSLPRGARPVNEALRLAGAAASVFVLHGSMARAQDAAVEVLPVRVRLFPQTTAAAPGETVQLAVILEMDDGWHLYWNGRNDTGFPVVLEPVVPDGCVAGTPLWPAPERYVDEAGTLDHVYRGSVAVFLPVTLSPGATPGESLELRCRVSYAVCRDICLLGESEVAGSITAASPGEAGRAAPSSLDRIILASSRARVPVSPRKAGLPLSARWKGNTLVLRVKGARALAFFPGAACAELEDPIADGAAGGDRLRLRFAPEGETMSSASGVLEVRPERGDRNLFVSLEVPRGASLEVCAQNSLQYSQRRFPHVP